MLFFLTRWPTRQTIGTSKKMNVPEKTEVTFLSSGWVPLKWIDDQLLFPSFLIVHTKRPPFFTDLAQLAMSVLGDVVSVSVSAPHQTVFIDAKGSHSCPWSFRNASCTTRTLVSGSFLSS
jgi:hypothetical protein